MEKGEEKKLFYPSTRCSNPQTSCGTHLGPAILDPFRFRFSVIYILQFFKSCQPNILFYNYFSNYLAHMYKIDIRMCR